MAGHGSGVTGRADAPGARGDVAGALTHSPVALRAMVDHVADTLVLLDDQGVIGWTSENALRTLGYEPEDVVGVHGLDLVHPADLDGAADALAEVLGTPGAIRRVTVRLRRKESFGEGGWRWYEIVGRNELHQAELGAIVLSLRDVDDSMARLAETARLTAMLDATSDLVVLTDTTFTVLWANPAADTLMTTEGPIVGTPLAERVPDTTTHLFIDEVIPCLRQSGRWRGEIEVLDALGTRSPLDLTVLTHRSSHGSVDYISLSGRDISDRIRLEQQLRHQATTDELTGLTNRSAFVAGADALLDGGVRDVAVFAVDIDRFKLVNDGHGHRVGDDVLCEMARRLRDHVADDDLVARSSGDEFFVLRRGIRSMHHARSAADALSAAVSGPLRIAGVDPHLTVSIGVTVAKELSTGSSLLAEADTAMYRAKSAGRGHVECFEGSMLDDTRSRLSIGHELRSAIGTGVFVPHFQPIVDSCTGRIVELEALVRWRHPQQGLLGPDAFLDVAEETGLIGPIGREVVDATCESLASWSPHHLPNEVGVAVNLSASEILDPDLADVIGGMLDRHGLCPQRLTVELTETLLLHDVDRTVANLTALRALGVRIAIDDFGTGYSSLAYLRDLPLDVLKIDRSFVAPIATERVSECSLVAGIVSIAHSLGLTVVAEGVETKAQAELLVELGCDRLQGFLFSPPLDASSVPLLWRGAA